MQDDRLTYAKEDTRAKDNEAFMHALALCMIPLMLFAFAVVMIVSAALFL